MAEAGHPNGFTYDWLTAGADLLSRAASASFRRLQEIGIRGRLQTMERGVY